MASPEERTSGDWFEKHTNPAVRSASLEFTEELELQYPPEMESMLFKLAGVENLPDFYERTKRYLGPMHKRAVIFLKEEYRVSEERYREHQKKQADEGVPEKLRTPKNSFIHNDLRVRMLAKMPDISDAVYLDIAENGKNSVVFNNNPKEKSIRQLLSAYEAENREQNLTPERMRQALGSPPPEHLPVEPVTSPQGKRYWLHELTIEDHLIQETYYLRHCLGNPKFPYLRNITPDGKGKRISRLFSVRDDNGIPFMTIEYRVQPQELWQGVGRNRYHLDLSDKHAFLIPFMAYLGKTLPIKSYRDGLALARLVRYAPTETDDFVARHEYLTEKGYLPLEEIDLDLLYVFPGMQFSLDDESFRKRIDDLKGRDINIDLTDVNDELKATLTESRAKIIDYSNYVSYPNLVTVTEISAINALTVELPSLRSGRVSIDVDRCKPLKVAPTVAVDRRKFIETKIGREIVMPPVDYLEGFEVEEVDTDPARPSDIRM